MIFAMRAALFCIAFCLLKPSLRAILSGLEIILTKKNGVCRALVALPARNCGRRIGFKVFGKPDSDLLGSYPIGGSLYLLSTLMLAGLGVKTLARPPLHVLCDRF